MQILYITVNVSFTGDICYMIMAQYEFTGLQTLSYTFDGVGAEFPKHVVPQDQLDSSLQFGHKSPNCCHMIEEKLSHVSVVGFQPALRIFAFAQATYLNVFYPHELTFESRSLKTKTNSLCLCHFLFFHEIQLFLMIH